MPKLTVSNPTTAEGDQLEFLFALDLPAQGGERVYYTNLFSFGTAELGIDFGEIDGFIDFTAGQLQAIISVPTFADTEIEGQEFMTLDYDTADFDVDSFWALGTIEDNQSHTPTATISIKADHNFGETSVRVSGLVGDLDGFTDLRSPDLFLEIPDPQAFGGKRWILLGTGGSLTQQDTSTGSWEQFIDLSSYLPGSYRIAAKPYDQDWEYGPTAVADFSISPATNTLPVIQSFNTDKVIYSPGETVNIYSQIFDADGIGDVELIRLYLNGVPLADLPIQQTINYAYQLPIDALIDEYVFTLSVSDEAGTDWQEAFFDVLPANQPPVVDITNVVVVGDTVSWDVVSYDPDGDSIVLVPGISGVFQGETLIYDPSPGEIVESGQGYDRYMVEGFWPGQFTVSFSFIDSSGAVSEDQETFVVGKGLSVATSTNDDQVIIDLSFYDQDTLQNGDAGQVWTVNPWGEWAMIDTIDLPASGSYGEFQTSISGLFPGTWTFNAYMWDNDSAAIEGSTTLNVPDYAPYMEDQDLWVANGNLNFAGAVGDWNGFSQSWGQIWIGSPSGVWTQLLPFDIPSSGTYGTYSESYPISGLESGVWSAVTFFGDWTSANNQAFYQTFTI